MRNKILNWYFTPKFFEKSGTLYKFLGVRIFKKFVPVTGDIAHRRTKTKSIPNAATETLRKYEKVTRSYEMGHLIFFLWFAIIPIWLMVTFATLGYPVSTLVYIGAIYFIINLPLNVYPIIIQRYNRARIYWILQKRGHLIS